MSGPRLLTVDQKTENASLPHVVQHFVNLTETESDNESEHSNALSSDIDIIDDDNDECLNYD